MTLDNVLAFHEVVLLVELAEANNNFDVGVKQRALVGHIGLGSIQVMLIRSVEGKQR
jgi:hypothetical protein